MCLCDCLLLCLFLIHVFYNVNKPISFLKDQNLDEQNRFLKIVKDITSKGFVRSNYKKNLVDLSDVKISLKGKK